MVLDPLVSALWGSRTAAERGTRLLASAWRGEPPGTRAARMAAEGDLAGAGNSGDEGWRRLADGDVVGALEVARAQRSQGRRSADAKLLEAEALCAAGAITAALAKLERLHRAHDPAATVALARRRHLLGDHRGAERVACHLPGHAHAALAGAKSAMMQDRVEAAQRLLDPFLHESAPIPEPSMAGAIAVVTAALLAKRGAYGALRRFATTLLEAPDNPPPMIPAIARVAWTAGLGQEAWERNVDGGNPWMTAARAELAILSGEAELAMALIGKAAPVSAPSMTAAQLLSGAPIDESAASRILTQAGPLHVWRTHPYRWRPWIEAAQTRTARVEICDLATRRIPDQQVIPQAVVDDGALVTLIEPKPVACKRPSGQGVWIGQGLCHGVGIGHDWPHEEDQRARQTLSQIAIATHCEHAAVCILSAEAALPHLERGRPLVVIAPPGDPFWGGPLPERAWPAIRVVRSDARHGWKHAGARAAMAAQALLAQGR